MAHVVCITTSLAGLLYASCELLRRLEADGHQVTYASPDEIEDIIHAQGFAFHQLPRSGLRDLQDQDRKQSKAQRLKKWFQRRETALKSLGVDDFHQDLKALKPDLLLIDLELHQHIISAVPTGVPVALLSPFYSIWKHPSVPPLHYTNEPGKGTDGSPLQIELTWLKYRIWKFRQRWKDYNKLVGIDSISVFRILAKKTGFRFRANTELHQWLIPFMFRSLPTLCLRALEAEFPHQPRSIHHYVGPMINLSRNDRPTPPELTALLEKHKNSAPEKKLIYCAFSSVRSFGDDLDFLKRIIAAVAEHPEWDLIVGMGGHELSDELKDLPEQIHLFKWAPQLEVLRHADAAIVHGGVNSYDECISEGVPMVVFSHEVVDMPGTRVRMIHHGVAIAGDRAKDNPEIIRKHLTYILENEEMHKRVHDMREKFEAHRSEKRAEKIVQSLLQ